MIKIATPFPLSSFPRNWLRLQLPDSVSSLSSLSPLCEETEGGKKNFARVLNFESPIVSKERWRSPPFSSSRLPAAPVSPRRQDQRIRWSWLTRPTSATSGSSRGARPRSSSSLSAEPLPKGRLLVNDSPFSTKVSLSQIFVPITVLD